MSTGVMSWLFGGWFFGDHHNGTDPGSSRQRRENPTAPPTRDRACTQNDIAGFAVPVLLARIQSGDRDALGVLYNELFHTLWSVAVFQARSPHVAEEIVHDVFLRFWMRRDSIRVDLDIRVYLAAAVRNRAHDLARRQRRADAFEEANAHDEVDSFSYDSKVMGRPAPATDAAVEEQEFADAFEHALGALSERERVAALLRWDERMTFEQIGEVLSLSNVGVRKIVLRAQDKVLAILGLKPSS